MIYFLYATTGCNLHCEYCGNDPEFMCMPLNPTYTVEELQQFVDRDMQSDEGQRTVLVFYGGEPLLNVPFVTKVLSTIDADFVLQTNATFLDRLSKQQLEQFTSILISIDGDRETVDRNRGKGTYDKCIAGCKAAQSKAKIKNLVARGCAMEGNDIYQSVIHLLTHPEVRFTHIYWQLNVGFDSPYRKEFEKYVDEVYNPGITKLIQTWIRVMEGGDIIEQINQLDKRELQGRGLSIEQEKQYSEPKRGKVLGIVPFICLAETMIEEEEEEERERLIAERRKSEQKEQEIISEEEQRQIIMQKRCKLRQIRCGIGQTAFTIATDAKIAACPCGVGEKWNMLSKDFRTIESPKKELTNRVVLLPPCSDGCDLASVCGGRCVYCSVTKYWGDDYKRVVCDKTIRHLVESVRGTIPTIRRLLREGQIKREFFQYPAERYSLEVIP